VQESEHNRIFNQVEKIWFTLYLRTMVNVRISINDSINIPRLRICSSFKIADYDYMYSSIQNTNIIDCLKTRSWWFNSHVDRYKSRLYNV